MNIRNVSNNGGVERGGDRPLRADGKRDRSATSAASGDSAAISSGGREAKASFDANVEAARGAGDERATAVARAVRPTARRSRGRTKPIGRGNAGRLAPMAT